MLVGLATQEVGASLAVMVFPQAGPIGMVALRMCFSAVVLWILVRPRLRGRHPRSWLVVAGYGTVLAAMNVCFYLALERLPLGTTVTLEMLGPLTLSVILGRRWMSLLWAAIALAGVIFLAGNPSTQLDPLGVTFALAAAVFWAGHILLTRGAGQHFSGFDGLTLGMTIGGLLVAPLALATTGVALFSPKILVIGLAIALLSSTIPYACEMRALRILSPGVFAVLLAQAPAIAAVAGWLILGQQLGAMSYVGIILVVVAGVGATRLDRRAEASGSDTSLPE